MRSVVHQIGERPGTGLYASAYITTAATKLARFDGGATPQPGDHLRIHRVACGFRRLLRKRRTVARI